MKLTSLATLLGLFFVCVPALSQDVQNPEMPAPPPLKQLTSEDRAQLEATKDIKARARLSVQLAENHLASAEQHTRVSMFDEASSELGNYRAVLEDALLYLSQSQKKGDKLRDSYKRIELALRAHTPRIETIRRSTPQEYAVNIKPLAAFIIEAREEALNSFYGDTVLREAKPDAPKNSNAGPAAKQTAPPETKEP